MLRRFSDSLGEAFPQPRNKRRRIDIGDDKRKNMFVNDNPQEEQCKNQQQALQVVLSHDFFNVRTKVWCDAIDAGKLDWIRFFAGASVNVCFHAWRETWTGQPLTTPLAYAIEKQKWDIVEWLVRDAGANPNFCPLPAAKTTARKIERNNSSDSFAIVSVLGPNTAYFPVVPLTHAVKRGHLTTVKTLVQHGARIHNVRACWQYTNEPGAAAETKSGDTTEDTPTGCHLVQKECDRFGYSALHWACTWWFDKREQDPDAYGQRLQLVDFLLNKGAEINENSNVLGRTQLHQLCSTCYAENKISVGGKMALLQLLLDNGADPNLTSRDGRTPLQLAMHKRSYFAVEYLLHRDPSLPWSSAPEAKEEASSATIAASTTTTAIAAPKLIRQAIKRNPLPVAALVTNYRVDKLVYSRSCKLLDKIEHQVWDEIEEPKYKQFLLFFYGAAVFGDWWMLEAVLVHLKLSSKEQKQSASFLVEDTTVSSYSASYSFEAERALKLLQFFSTIDQWHMARLS